MTTNINSSKSASASFSSIISEAVLSSVKANKISAVLTVKNYSIEADAQKTAIANEVSKNYDTEKDNIDAWTESHKHKRKHKIFGAIFHAIRAVVHLCQPRKMIKSVKKVVKNIAHPKSAAKSMLHLKKAPSLTKGLAKQGAKDATRATKVLKYAEKGANWGNVGLAAYDGVGKVKIDKLKADIEKLQIEKSVCENNYDMLESEKKQEMQTVSDRLSDVSSTLNTVNQIINRQSSMQSQIVNSI